MNGALSHLERMSDAPNFLHLPNRRATYCIPLGRSGVASIHADRRKTPRRYPTSFVPAANELDRRGRATTHRTTARPRGRLSCDTHGTCMPATTSSQSIRRRRTTVPPFRNGLMTIEPDWFGTRTRLGIQNTLRKLPLVRLAKAKFERIVKWQILKGSSPFDNETPTGFLGQTPCYVRSSILKESFFINEFSLVIYPSLRSRRLRQCTCGWTLLEHEGVGNCRHPIMWGML